MNEVPEPLPVAEKKAVSYEISLLDVLVIVAKRKKLVFGLPVLVTLAALATSFLLPNVYLASTKLLPPQQVQSSASAILSQLGGVAGAMAGGAGLKSPNDMYVGMLRSRTVADKIIEKYDLKKVYGTASQEEARKYLGGNTTVTAGKDGLIIIDVEDENQKLVAQLANGYVDALLDLTRILAVTEASQRRMFYERQLELAKNNLASAEITLKKALTTRGVISVDSESRAIVETVGRVRAQVSAKEIELGSMRAFLTTSNPEYRRAEEELNSLRAELAKLENGRAAAPGDRTEVPPVGLENIRVLRDVKYYQMLYELLAKQYEVARLDEAKDPSIVQVLDRAVEPERKFKPKRSLIVLAAAILSFLFVLAWIFLAEMKARALRSSRGAEQWAEFTQQAQKF